MGVMRNLFVFTYKTALAGTPHGLKYATIAAWQRKKPPYHVIREGDTVVQVGAAGHLCPLGRSQAIIFSKLIGPTGKVFAFEVIPENMALFESYIREHRIENIAYENIGLWDEKALLTFGASQRGPSSARARGIREEDGAIYEADRQLPVDTLDNLLAERRVQQVAAINVTTNGAESRIIEGGWNCIERDRPIICVPDHDNNVTLFERLLTPLGYRLFFDSVKLHPLGKPLDILWAMVGDE